MIAGSNITRTASVCPVIPVQTSRYVGFGVWPAAYPTAVEYTPFSCQNFRSAPQKQPIAKMARSKPPGNGGVRRWPFTKCASGTCTGSVCPGNASAFELGFRREQLLDAAGTSEGAGPFLGVQRTAAGPFGPMFSQDVKLLGRQCLPPVFLSFQPDVVIHSIECTRTF